MFNALPHWIDFPRLPLWARRATILAATFFLLSSFGATTAYAATDAVTWPPVGLKPIATGFSSPIDVVSANDGTGRLFVLEQGGKVFIIENGERVEDPFLDIADRVATCFECGILGIAFPSNFAAEGYFFVNYTSNTDLVGPDTGDGDSTAIGDTVIARFHVTGDPNVADSAVEEQILVINQPAINHNGGHILFGPEGYLYIGMGDGGTAGDTFANAQDPASLHGKILRIAVGETLTYTIPVDNPFIATAGYRDEIWAMGVRNPWRYNFDPTTGDLYIGDVGQGSIEEVSHVAAADIGNGGMNFGWPIMEGSVCYPPSDDQDCEQNGLTLPVVTYTHASGNCSVTGGFVYSSPIPGQEPVYLYGDYCTGRVWGLQQDGVDWVSSQLEGFPFHIASFGEDTEGNTYLVSHSGIIYILDDSIAGLTAANDGPAEVGNPISFSTTITPITGGSDVAYTWDFDDGSSGTGITTTHSYTQSGVYTVTATATNATNSMSATTTVYMGDVVVDVTNNQYTPQNITVNPGEKVVWVLQEGTHSVSADDASFEQLAGDSWPPFVQEFVSAESIDTVVFQYHCTVHLGMTGSVTVQSPEPVADLTVGNDGPTLVNGITSFSTTISAGTTVAYAWQFGDGNSGSSIAPTHTYTESGVYTATVVASNQLNSMTATTTVYVGDQVVDVASNFFDPPNVTIAAGGKVIWELQEGTHSVTADDDSFEQPAGDSWSPFVQEFNLATVSSAFGAAAVFTYHCSVHDGMVGSVTVTEAPPQPPAIAGLNATNDGPTQVTTPTSFTATITAGLEIAYVWDFGDGYSGTGITTTHTYTESGLYTATVVATNATNSVSDTTTVYVGDAIIDVGNNFFDPSSVSVPIGGKVVWVLREGFHDVVADDDSFEQPASTDWPPFMKTFPTANIYTYQCTIHNGMVGSVTVGVPPVEGDTELRLPTIRLND